MRSFCLIQANYTQATRTWKLGIDLEQHAPKWAFVGRYHDATPIRLGFGMLQGLQNVARYWHRSSDGGPARLLDYASYARATQSSLPSYGIIEMMAQNASIAWPELVNGQQFVVHQQDLQFSPMFLERGASKTASSHCLTLKRRRRAPFPRPNRCLFRFVKSCSVLSSIFAMRIRIGSALVGNSSTILGALEAADPSLSMASLREMARHIDYVVLNIGTSSKAISVAP